MLYNIITFAGACQLTNWLFALVDIIERRPASKQDRGGIGE